MMNKEYQFQSSIADGIVKELFFNMKAKIPVGYICTAVIINNDTKSETIMWKDKITSNNVKHLVPIVQSDQKFDVGEVKTHKEWDEWILNLHGRFQFYFTVDEQAILFEMEEDLVLYKLCWMT